MTTIDEDPVDAVTWMIRGHWVSLTIRAAIELGLLDQLERPTTVADLATATGSDLSGMQRVVRVLADLGLVEASGAAADAGDLVTITARGRALTVGHPSGLRNLALMQTVLPTLASWQRLADAVRTGDSVFEDVNGIGPWESLSANPQQEAIFNAAMARRGANQVAAILGTQDLSSVELVVDVGGGSGSMLAGLLVASPGMRGIVADRVDVAAEAQTYLDAAGLGDRAQGEPADFFTSVPAGGDVYVLANVLHDWADDDAVRILRTIRAAMGAAARLWIVEHVLDSPDRGFEDLRDLHLVDLNMLVMFGARERTAAEYDALLLASGFGSGVLATTRHGWDVIEAQPTP
jgi:hypothetical protein